MEIQNYQSLVLTPLHLILWIMKILERIDTPANYRCMDGHYVRSRAEVMIDNWLYGNGIADAYERKLPIESDV